MQAAIGGMIQCPIIVGRSRQLDVLRGLADAASTGGGQVALIGGEAGVGKSRLASEIVAYAAAKGFLVLRGRCFEQDVSSPYAPLLDLLRAQFVRQPAPARADDLNPTTRELVRLLPGILPPPPDLPAEPQLDADSRKRRLFAALTRHVADSAARQPLLLLFEDLHWSDDGSLELLLHLARFSAGQPMLLLLTYRLDDEHPRLRHWLAQMERERLVRELQLERLARDEVGAMLQAIFALQRPARPEFLEAIYELTEGNPFFIEEVLKSLVAEGDIFHDARGWDRKPLSLLRIPRTVHDAVRQRVAHLSAPAGRVITLAAVAGRRFDIPLLRELAQLDEAALVEALKELSAAQLVVEESADRFAFRHALTRQAIYANLLARERRALHAAIAEIFERIHTAPEEHSLADLAYHYSEAEQWEKALEYGRRAGEHARALYAPQAAIQHFSRALEAARHLSAVPALRLHLARGAAYDMLGDFTAASADYEAALDQARSAHDRQAEWEALLAKGALYAERDYAQTGRCVKRALEVAREARDQRMVARSLNRVGNWHLNVGELAEALAFHHEALTCFAALGSQRGLAETHDLLGMTYNISGDPQQSSYHYTQAIALFRELDDRQGLVNSLVILLLQSGSYWHETLLPAALAEDEGWRIGDEALRTAREIGWLAGESYVLYELALWLGPRGEYLPALQHARSALAIAEAIGHEQWITGCHAALGVLYLDMLALPLAREHLERALGLAQKIGSRLWIAIVSAALACACIIQHDLPRAVAVLDAADSDAAETEAPMRTLGQRMVWCARAELALANRHAAEALRIVERLIATAPNLDDDAVIPRLWRLRGEALAALRRPEEAEAALLAAHAHALRLGMRPLLWRIHVSLAHVYQAARRQVAAAREFTAARSLVADLAAEIAEEDMRRTFLEGTARMLPMPRTPSDLQAAKQAYGGLTRREREVARLIAQGKSNSEISDILVIGKRTVESHISSILTKLSCTSRAQIVVWAIARDLS